MRPRRPSMDSETSSDSWSVIQKNVEHHEHSGDDAEFEPSDSEEWDSHSDQETDDCDSDDNDSLEDYDATRATDDDGGADCELLDEDEAMEGGGCRYYVPSEKISKSLDLLDAECCSNFDSLLRWMFSSRRDTARVAVLLFFAISTALLLSARNPRQAEVDHSSEVFASGLQSREDFGRVFSTSLRRHPGRFNFSETCNWWQVSFWPTAPKWPGKDRAATLPLPLPDIFNSTPKVEINEEAFFTRPTMKLARISISHYAKPRNVCRQEDVVRRRRRVPPPSLASISDDDEVLDVGRWVVTTPSYLLAAPISISRMAKQQGDVCSKQVRREKLSSSAKTGRSQPKDTIKMLTGRHPPRITYKKPAYIDLKLILARPPPPKRPSFSKKLIHGPCYAVSQPCIEKNTTMKRYKGVKSLLARPTSRQLSKQKRRAPMPSLPRMHRPCVDHQDEVKCWKSLGQRLQQGPPPSNIHKQSDWFTRRGQIRAEKRRN